MKKQSWMRQAKRKAMRNNQARWTDRVYESIRLHTPVRNINWKNPKPTQEKPS